MTYERLYADLIDNYTKQLAFKPNNHATYSIKRIVNDIVSKTRAGIKIRLSTDKKAVFNAFADKSVAAMESRELDDKTFGDIIKEEIDRINAKRGQKEEIQADQNKD